VQQLGPQPGRHRTRIEQGDRTHRRGVAAVDGVADPAWKLVAAHQLLDRGLEPLLGVGVVEAPALDLGLGDLELVLAGSQRIGDLERDSHQRPELP